MAAILRDAQGAAAAAVAANRSRDTKAPKSTKSKPSGDPEIITRVEVGPITIAVLASGDFLIYTTVTRDETHGSSWKTVTIRGQKIPVDGNRLLVKALDVDDLLVALDGALERRPVIK